MNLRISTYDELAQYAQSFASGRLGLTVLVGEGGLGKTTVVAKALAAVSGHVIEGGGELTALGLYTALYRYRDLPIAVDDVDKLYTDTSCIRILKAATQTTAHRHIAWHTSRLGPDTDPPNEFDSTSALCVITNEFVIANANTRAIADRGVMLEFAPNPDEVHRAAGEWCKDREVYAYVGERLDSIPTHSFRAYYVATQLRDAGHDWRSALEASWAAHPELVALREVNRDPTLTTQEERVARWCQRTGLSRKSYYRYAERHPHLAPVRAYARGKKAL